MHPDLEPDRRSGIVIAALLCATGLVLTVAAQLPGAELSYPRFAVPKELVFNGFAFVTAALLLVSTRRLELDAGVFLLLGFLAFASVSVYAAEASWQLGLRPTGLYVSFVVVILCAQAFVRHGRRELVLAGLCAAVGLGTLGVLLEVYAAGIGGPSILGRGPGGWLGNRNYNAHLVAIALPALWALCVATERRALRAASLAVLFASAIVLVVTRTRAAWLALLVAIPMALALGVYFRASFARSAERFRTPGQRPVYMAAAVCVAGLLFGTFVPNQLEWSAANPVGDTLAGLTEYESGSGAGRLVQYRQTLEMVADRPLLGVGPGNWQAIYPLYEHETEDAGWGPVGTVSPTSEWLGIASEMGLPALLLLLGWCGLAVWRGIAALGSARRGDACASSGSEPYALALLVTLAVVGILGALDALVMRPSSAFVLAVVMGALQPRSAARWRPGLGLAAKATLAVALAVLGVGVLWPSMNQSRALYARATLPRAEALASVVELVPWDYDAHNELSTLYLGRGDCKLALAHADASRRVRPQLDEEQMARVMCRTLEIPANPHAF